MLSWPNQLPFHVRTSIVHALDIPAAATSAGWRIPLLTDRCHCVWNEIDKSNNKTALPLQELVPVWDLPTLRYARQSYLTRGKCTLSSPQISR